MLICADLSVSVAASFRTSTFSPYVNVENSLELACAHEWRMSWRVFSALFAAEATEVALLIIL